MRLFLSLYLFFPPLSTIEEARKKIWKLPPKASRDSRHWKGWTLSFEVNKFIFAWVLIKKTSLCSSDESNQKVVKHDFNPWKYTHAHAESLIAGNLYDNYKISDQETSCLPWKLFPLGSFYSSFSSSSSSTNCYHLCNTHPTRRHKKVFRAGILKP